MSQSYVYDIATETASGTLNSDVMAQTLLDAGPASGGTVEGLDVQGGTYDAGNVVTGGTLTVTWQNALSGADETAQDALVAAHTGPSFGAEVQETSDEAVSSTTLTTPQTKLTLASTPVSAGPYTVTAYCEIRLQSVVGGSGVRAAVTVQGGEEAEDNWDATTWHAFSAEAPKTFKAGDAPTLTITFERTGSFNTVEIRRARLEMAVVG